MCPPTDRVNVAGGVTGAIAEVYQLKQADCGHRI